MRDSERAQRSEVKSVIGSDGAIGDGATCIPLKNSELPRTEKRNS